MKFKRKSVDCDDMVNQRNDILEIETKNLQTSISDWMSSILGRPIGNNLVESLEDGRDLCELFETVIPDVPLKFPLFKRDNISVFIQGCKDIGIPSNSILDYVYFESKNSYRLVGSLLLFIKTVYERKGQGNQNFSTKMSRVSDIFLKTTEQSLDDSILSDLSDLDIDLNISSLVYPPAPDSEDEVTPVPINNNNNNKNNNNNNNNNNNLVNNNNNIDVTEQVETKDISVKSTSNNNIINTSNTNENTPTSLDDNEIPLTDEDFTVNEGEQLYMSQGQIPIIDNNTSIVGPQDSLSMDSSSQDIDISTHKLSPILTQPPMPQVKDIPPMPNSLPPPRPEASFITNLKNRPGDSAAFYLNEKPNENINQEILANVNEFSIMEKEPTIENTVSSVSSVPNDTVNEVYPLDVGDADLDSEEERKKRLQLVLERERERKREREEEAALVRHLAQMQQIESELKEKQIGSPFMASNTSPSEHVVPIHDNVSNVPNVPTVPNVPNVPTVNSETGIVDNVENNSIIPTQQSSTASKIDDDNDDDDNDSDDNNEIESNICCLFTCCLPKKRKLQQHE
ncbi:hypothetical protein WA158_004526 [Blastocystis sp. Blastoise]